jgi:penicillin-binding protein 1A
MVKPAKARRRSRRSTPPSGQRRRRNQAPTRQSGWRRFVWFALSFFVWASVGIAAVVAWYAYDLPDIARLDRATARKPVVTIEAVDGSVLARYGEVHGDPVRVRALPPHLPRAFLAIEDRRFYRHPGIDLLGIARATYRNLLAGGIREGGSTITQQLAKNLFLTRKRSLRRKVQEALLAFWLERQFTKDQILSIYLNRVYFGGGVYGVDAAAQRYFSVPAKKVTLFQAAVLAGLVRAPSRDNPIADPKRAAARANLVLTNMAEAGWIASAAAQKARRATVAPRPRQARLANARYFADWVLDRIDDYLGYHGGDLVIRTTLDPYLQQRAEERMHRTVADNAKRKVGQGALVALAPDGAVRAMIGGRDYAASQFNRVTQARRQPGSAFKLFVYLAALESGMRPGDSVEDRPITVEGWTPRNAGRRHRGAVTFREGAARSSNAVAVALAERAGRERVIGIARRLGITAPLRPDPSLALGAHAVSLLELSGAYAAIANGGQGVWPYGIVEIRDGAGRTLHRRKGGGPGRVVARRNVEALNDLFTAVVAWGTGKAARLDRPAAGKTGTSQGNRDAWFVGYTPDLVTGVWFGNDDYTPMRGVGGGLAAAAWRGFMRDALASVPPRPLPGVNAAPDPGRSVQP